MLPIPARSSVVQASRSKGELPPTRAGGEGRREGALSALGLHMHRTRPRLAPPASSQRNRAVAPPAAWVEHPAAEAPSHLSALPPLPPRHPSSPPPGRGRVPYSRPCWGRVPYSRPCSLALRAQLGLQPHRRGGSGDSHEHSCRPTPAAAPGGAPHSGSGPLRLGMATGRAAARGLAHTTPTPAHDPLNSELSPTTSFPPPCHQTYGMPRTPTPPTHPPTTNTTTHHHRYHPPPPAATPHHTAVPPPRRPHRHRPPLRCSMCRRPPSQ